MPDSYKRYNPSACCGDDCFMFERNPEEPCWGDVSVASEEYSDYHEEYIWIHECEGHAGCYDYGDKYQPIPERSQQ